MIVGKNECADGIDNDHDGLLDMEDDGCSYSDDDSELIPQCNDGEDNDGDGKIDGADPMCSSSGDDSESPKNSGSSLACGVIDLSNFEDRYPGYFTEDDAPAYVNVPRNDVNEQDFRTPALGEIYRGGTRHEVDFVYENHYRDGSNYSNESEDDSGVNSAQYGFAEPLPADTEIDLEFEVAMKWVDGNGHNGGATDAGEYGLVETYIAFYDENGDIVASKEIETAGGVNPGRHGSFDEHIEDYSGGDPEGDNVETQYISRTFSNIGGAVSMRVSNSATSFDDAEDHGRFDHSDDYNGDPDVWAGLIRMNVDSPSGCYTAPSNRAPIARDDGTPADPLSVQGAEVHDLDVLFNDGQGDGSGVDLDGDTLTITDVTHSGSAQVQIVGSGTRLRYNPNTLPDGATDHFTYTISDGNGASDTAVVNIEISATGQVTINAGPEVSYTPWWKTKGNKLDTKEGESTYTVPLNKQPEKFGLIRRGGVSVGGTKTLPDSDLWITKYPQHQNFTQSNNTIELGLSHDETCDPTIPTIKSGQLNSFNSAGGDNVLITDSQYHSEHINQCAEVTGRLHPDYTRDIDDYANWVWLFPQQVGSGAVSAADGEVATFQKQFRVPDISEVTSAEIHHAADNYYEVRVNGSRVYNLTESNAASPEDGYENARTSDIASELTQGLNTVEFTVTNEGSDPASGNPAALIYRIQVDTRENNSPSASASASYGDRLGASQLRYNLSAGGSSDPEGDNLSYQWQVIDAESNDPGQPANPLYANIANTTAQNTSVTVSNQRSDTAITYTIQLTVSDGENTDTDTTNVSVSCDSTNAPGSCAYEFDDGGSGGGGGGIGFE